MGGVIQISIKRSCLSLFEFASFSSGTLLVDGAKNVYKNVGWWITISSYTAWIIMLFFLEVEMLHVWL